MSETQNNPRPEIVSRKLIRSCDRAVLSTLLAEDGSPYGSLVMTACDHSAHPILLISDLAEHTKNLNKDNRASLLFDGTVGLDSPLTGARVTVVGTLSRTEEPAVLNRYTSRHPESEMFTGFGDFNFYQMNAERAHLVAGFGAIHWIDAEKIGFDVSGHENLVEAEADIVSHMNDDHADAVQLYASKLLGLPGDDWIMTGLDPEGCDLRLGGKTARLDFEKPVENAEAARAALVKMVKAARSQDGSRKSLKKLF